ncbi:MAG TPA: TadE/TadG family type IV pilus assembly protein [Caulobacteraceae bacterium]|jgi:Flp pilus assembly protein TadG
MISRTIAAFLRGRRGAAAAEYALVLPATLFLTLGIFNLSVVLFAISGLNRVTEAAARYASVQTALNGADPGAAAVRAFALSNYAGPIISPAFTYTATGCGHTVHATGTYTLVTGFAQVPLNLSANACFP